VLAGENWLDGSDVTHGAIQVRWITCGSATESGQEEVWFRAREALLKPQYREWYPSIIPGVGYRASWLASTLFRERPPEQGSELGPRIPSEPHFVFRDGCGSGGQTQPANRLAILQPGAGYAVGSQQLLTVSQLLSARPALHGRAREGYDEST
jgi:hypothetical protein